MKAVLELVAEYGFHGTQLVMVAETAGIGTGTIYLYFETKDALIVETYSELKQRMFDAGNSRNGGYKKTISGDFGTSILLPHVTAIRHLNRSFYPKVKPASLALMTR